MHRYAIYFAPDPASPLWRFGSTVVGYDAATGHDLPSAATTGHSTEAWRLITEEPRRYGFHATLKAPFELAARADPTAVLVATQQLAAYLAPVTLAGLRVAEIGRFIALVPSQPSADLLTLAATVVDRLDHLRAPLSQADRARRLRSPLTPRQVAYLDRYGYPYVLDEFRFHMTLTGPIDDAAERARIREALAAAYATAVTAGPVVIDALALFRQDRRDDRFRIVAHCPLTGPTVTSVPARSAAPPPRGRRR